MRHPTTVNILMLGRGVIATLYGHALQQVGHEVEFLVRPGRAARYGDTVTLDVLDARPRPWGRPWGRRRQETWPIRYRETLAPHDGFDLVVLSVPHHRLPAAAHLLAPRIGDATVLVFGNVWDEPHHAVAPLPPAQLAWGFPQAGGGFDHAGVLHGALLPSVLLGTTTPPTPREHAVRRLFHQAGFRLREEPDLRGWLWWHVTFDAGMHAQAARRGTLAHLVGSRADLREALLTARELLPLLQARGVDLRRHRTTTLPLRAPGLTASVMSLAMRTSALARASLEAHTDPDAEEPSVLLRDVVAEARRLGVPVPRLENTPGIRHV